MSRRSLEGWLAQLAAGEDARAAVDALRARLTENVDQVELVGRRDAA
jgi:hypothetical protein